MGGSPGFVSTAAIAPARADAVYQLVHAFTLAKADTYISALYSSITAAVRSHLRSDDGTGPAHVMRWAMSQWVDADRFSRPLWAYLVDAAYFAIHQASQCPAFTQPPASDRLAEEPCGDDVWADGALPEADDALPEGAEVWEWGAGDAGEEWAGDADGAGE